MADPKAEPILFKLEQDLNRCAVTAEALQGKLPPVPGMSKDTPRMSAQGAADYRSFCEKAAFWNAERMEAGIGITNANKLADAYKSDTKHMREMQERLDESECSNVYLQDELADARGQERRKDSAFNRARKFCFERARQQDNNKK